MCLLNFFFLFVLIISSSADDCGRQKASHGLSIGGEYSEKGQWPWLASIFFRNKYFCGSSIISKKHLLGAAHCIHPKGQMDRLPTADYHAYLALYDLNNKNDPNAVRKEFHEIFVHSGWNAQSDSYDSDIALYLVKTEIQFNDYIQPICLPASSTKIFDTLGVVAGFGLSEKQPIHETRPKHVQIKTVDQDVCLFAEPVFASISSRQMFCAGSRGKNPCKGDSGGPFMAKNADRWTIIGIVSASVAKECHENDFVIFTQVPPFLDWIESTTDIKQVVTNVDEQPCGTFAKYDPINSKNDPMFNGFKGGVNYDNMPEFIGYGNGERCSENPGAGFVTTGGSHGAGVYIPCGRGGQIFDNQSPYYLLKHKNLQWTPTNVDEMLFVDGVVTTPGDAFAWGRYKDQGQYRVGKVHWVSGQAGNEWSGFYVQLANDREIKLSSGFEILSCKPEFEQPPCGTFIKYDPIYGKNDPSINGVLGGFDYDNTKEFIGYGDNHKCGEFSCAGFISTDTKLHGSQGAGVYMPCKNGVSFDNQHAHYLAKSDKLKWRPTNRNSMNNVVNILRTPNPKIAWGRIKDGGYYRVGKVHLDWGFYVQTNNSEVYHEHSFEILTCE